MKQGWWSQPSSVWGGRMDSPLHYDEQTCFPLVHVLIQAEDLDDVRTSGDSPVQLDLPPGFRSVVEDLLKTQHTTSVRARCNAEVSCVYTCYAISRDEMNSINSVL